MTKDEALQMCLEYIETNAHERKHVRHAIQAALAQPAQEPVNLLEARRIAAEYGTPDSQIDSGNLYFALMKCLEHIDAQPAQEPVAEVKPKMTGGNVGIATVIHEIYSPHREPLQPGDKLYTTPPQREWVGLTDEDKHKPDMGKYVYLNDDWLDGYQTGMEYAEAKLKEKNFD